MTSRLRPIGAGVIAGGALGLLLGGVGARIVMRLIALADDRLAPPRGKGAAPVLQAGIVLVCLAALVGLTADAVVHALEIAPP